MSDHSAENQKYVDEIIKSIRHVAAPAALEVAAMVFEKAVEETVQDSGQAAAQWYFIPYVDAAVALPVQQIMWGFDGHTPIPPVGYKGDKGLNAEFVHIAQMEELAGALASAPENITGVMVYNPITKGFPGFVPGSDEAYLDNAFGIELDEALEDFGQTVKDDIEQEFTAKLNNA